MIGIAIERWSFTQRQEVMEWLTHNFGNSTKQTWFLDQDFDLLNLEMNEKIYVVYKLRWS